MNQGNLFDGHEDALPKTGGGWRFEPDLPKIRAELRAWIDEARAAEEMPQDRVKFSYRRTVLPQMSRWLPDDERAELIRAFDAEVARLTGAV